jgi:quercetin dioxygenase-like cupin family protein
MGELIRVGQLEIRFICDKSETGGSVGMFEFTVPPGAKVPMPHYHRDYDETNYGLSGRMAWVLDGRDLEVGPGDHIFIPRGAVHSFHNRGDVPAVSLTVLTPDLIGPEYFRELGALFAGGGPPDPAKAREIMLRYGLVPVPAPA